MNQRNAISYTMTLVRCSESLNVSSGRYSSGWTARWCIYLTIASIRPCSFAISGKHPFDGE